RAAIELAQLRELGQQRPRGDGADARHRAQQIVVDAPDRAALNRAADLMIHIGDPAFQPTNVGAEIPAHGRRRRLTQALAFGRKRWSRSTSPSSAGAVVSVDHCSPDGCTAMASAALLTSIPTITVVSGMRPPPSSPVPTLRLRTRGPANCSGSSTTNREERAILRDGLRHLVLIGLLFPMTFYQNSKR